MDKNNIKQEYITQSLQKIGRDFAARRKEKGWTQSDLASAMDVSRDHIARSESGNHSYSMTFFVAWCHHLGVSPEAAVLSYQNSQQKRNTKK